MSDTSPLNELNIRNLMLELVSEISDNEVAVFLSSGIDSRCILFALLEYGKKVHAYSFTLDDRISTDCRVAEEVAKTYGVEFTRILLPTDINILKKDVVLLHDKYKCRKKTEYECVWPFLYSYKIVDEKVVAQYDLRRECVLLIVEPVDTSEIRNAALGADTGAAEKYNVVALVYPSGQLLDGVHTKTSLLSAEL